ncbi:MAG: hypothetical protein KKE20_04425 [Nanoarchaeota archaeon]|nr:hypothetical protein [Nanoarchaeota archaeon]
MRDEYLIMILLMSLLFLTACSKTENCSQYENYEDCPESCSICPPCPACSSISCQTPEFCESMGYDKNWYTSE